MEPSVLLVEALYSFKGKNNDELNFKKGAVITVTQNDDETWWEGTHDGTTGWFPSNYVQPYHPAESKETTPKGAQSPVGEQQMYRALVLRNLLDSERQHLSELRQLLTDCLRPLTSMNQMSSSSFTSLVGHLDHITHIHEELLSRLEHEGEKPSADQRVGGVFLTMAAEQLSQAHKDYCTLHPRAVCFLQEHQAEISRFIESTSLCADSSEGARKKPGLLLLTTGMSKPFRRLQQYSGQLQELHRHLPEAHKDRGDALRAAKVMAELTSSCQSIRRQKELELEVVTRELVGWDRGTLSVLGEVVAMGSVAVLPDHTDRYLVVFPKHLVVLGVSTNMSNFIFQSEHGLADITCRKLEDCEQYKNAFELTGPKMERMIALCQSKSDQQQWVTRLTQQPVTSKLISSATPVSSSSSSQPQLPPRKPFSGKRSVDVFPQQQQPQPPPPLPPSHVSRDVEQRCLDFLYRALLSSCCCDDGARISELAYRRVWSAVLQAREKVCHKNGTSKKNYSPNIVPKRGSIPYRLCKDDYYESSILYRTSSSSVVSYRKKYRANSLSGQDSVRNMYCKKGVNRSTLCERSDSNGYYVNKFKLKNNKTLKNDIEKRYSINSSSQNKQDLSSVFNSSFNVKNRRSSEEYLSTYIKVCFQCGLPLYSKHNKKSMKNYNRTYFCSCGGVPIAAHKSLPPRINYTDAVPHVYDVRREPYVTLTRFFRRLYRRKIITRALLRELSGDKYDMDAAARVSMRRKCDADGGVSCDQRTRNCRVASSSASDEFCLLFSSSTSVVWDFQASQEPYSSDVLSSKGSFSSRISPPCRLSPPVAPHVLRKQYLPNVKLPRRSNLVKWKNQRCLDDGSFCSWSHSDHEEDDEKPISNLCLSFNTNSFHHVHQDTQRSTKRSSLLDDTALDFVNVIHMSSINNYGMSSLSKELSRSALSWPCDRTSSRTSPFEDDNLFPSPKSGSLSCGSHKGIGIQTQLLPTTRPNCISKQISGSSTLLQTFTIPVVPLISSAPIVETVSATCSCPFTSNPWSVHNANGSSASQKSTYRSSVFIVLRPPISNNPMSFSRCSQFESYEQSEVLGNSIRIQKEKSSFPKNYGLENKSTSSKNHGGATYVTCASYHFWEDCKENESVNLQCQERNWLSYSSNAGATGKGSHTFLRKIYSHSASQMNNDPCGVHSTTLPSHYVELQFHVADVVNACRSRTHSTRSSDSGGVMDCSHDSSCFSKDLTPARASLLMAGADSLCVPREERIRDHRYVVFSLVQNTSKCSGGVKSSSPKACPGNLTTHSCSKDLRAKSRVVAPVGIPQCGVKCSLLAGVTSDTKVLPSYVSSLYVHWWMKVII
ncbi:SH3 domain [Trinorchestia longiramus]|nr:SH3 domain [Trinorchestia longiramus]